jgi:hypothetical protein
MSDTTLFIGTVYNAEGKRVGVEISSSGLDHIKERMAIYKKTSPDCTTKIWECKEIKE